MFERLSMPYVHFLADGVSLPFEVAKELTKVANEQDASLGESTGSRADYGNRLFINTENVVGFSEIVKDFFFWLDSSEGRESLGKDFGVDLSKGDLRIELVSDVDGFWQVPHLDTTDKLITWLTYLGTVEENGDVGTDIYIDSDTYSHSAPWGFNNGLVFLPSSNSWHGFSKGKVITGVRKVLIVNFVNGWKDQHELFNFSGF
jgi:hypothetical protein